jgi:hypothetical protein
MLENLKKALSKILATIEQVAKAEEDGQIVLKEWIQIGVTALGWIWIFKNLKAIKADIEAGATQEEWDAMNEELKNEFEIPQANLEETIEQALGIITLILSLVGKKVNVKVT